MVIVIVHGGAAKIPLSDHEEKLAGVIKAVKRGYAVFQKEFANSIDAVVESVTEMEDNPAFNAGYGSSLTVKGTVENDAIVISGNDLRVGAVASITQIKNPVQLARLVMDRSQHCLYSGNGAHDFASRHGIKLISNHELIHEKAKLRLQKSEDFATTIKNSMCDANRQPSTCAEIAERKTSVISRSASPLIVNDSTWIGDHDTVGAVAMDSSGQLACATSTGGLTAKECGRIGDSPLAGAGGWAEDGVCAISATGHGESIMRAALCKHIAMRMSMSMNTCIEQTNMECLENAVDEGLQYMQNKVGGGGAGVIAVGPQGEIVVRCTTPHMVWAAIDGERNKLYYGILPGEKKCIPLELD